MNRAHTAFARLRFTHRHVTLVAATTSPTRAMKKVPRFIERFGRSRASRALLDRVLDAPIEALDREVDRLLRHHGRREVRTALVERVKVAPRDHFPVLRVVFTKHFAHLRGER